MYPGDCIESLVHFRQHEVRFESKIKAQFDKKSLSYLSTSSFIHKHIHMNVDIVVVFYLNTRTLHFCF